MEAKYLHVKKKTLPLRSTAKPAMQEVPEGGAIYSYHIPTKHVKLAMKTKNRFVDMNTVFKEKDCIYLPAADKQEAILKFQTFINHHEKKQSESGKELQG